MNNNPPADWLEFWVRFVCGGLLGGVLSLVLLRDTELTVAHAWMLVAACVVVVGLAAAWFGDRFWHAIARMFSFW